jgi:probable biosynthetic protein (TIGR04099 family)
MSAVAVEPVALGSAARASRLTVEAMYGLLHNDVVVDFEQARTRGTVTAASEARSTAAILLGMPHLTGHGLSEHWLIKELGQRHWLLLAEFSGMSAPRFCDRRGDPVYGVFCAISIEEGGFWQAQENHVLQIASSLARISDTEIQSSHQLAIDGFAIGNVTMVSMFVSRTPGHNYATAIAIVDGLPPVTSAVADFAALNRQGPGGTALPRSLATLAEELRAGRLGSHLGFDPRVEKEACSVPFDPCPSVDFNSAGFMYFANLIAMIDRAEFRLDRAAAIRATTADRDVFFHGTIVRSETVEVRLLGWKREDHQILHHFRMVRGSDGNAVADVFSRRVLGLPRSPPALGAGP